MFDKSLPVATVAGISSGLGGALGRCFAGAGYRVVGLARTQDFSVMRPKEETF